MADEETAPTTESEQQSEGPRGLSLLANNLFGENFHGEVKQPEKPEAEETAEAGAEPESEEKAEPEAAETEEGEVPISSVSELIQHYELDPEWFEALKVQAKVDGEPAEFTIKELRDRAQMLQAADKRLEEAKEKAKAQTQELSQKSEALQEQFATAAKLIENAETLLDQDTGAIDWKKLREDDPAEYSAKKAEIAERRQQLEQAKEDAKHAWHESVRKQQEQLQGQQKQHLQSEHAALLDKLPEWKDAEKAQAEKTRISEYLTGSMGFSHEDVMGASDHRLILMARKAMLYDELQANSNAAKKKVAKVPKVMKPGTPKSRDQVNKEQERKARDRLRQTGSLNDAYALLKARRGGN